MNCFKRLLVRGVSAAHGGGQGCEVTVSTSGHINNAESFKRQFVTY